MMRAAFKKAALKMFKILRFGPGGEPLIIWGKIYNYSLVSKSQCLSMPKSDTYRASQGLVKDSHTFKNFSITAIHYLTAMTCGMG